jgi:hypothetical protein
MVTGISFILWALALHEMNRRANRVIVFKVTAGHGEPVWCR